MPAGAEIGIHTHAHDNEELYVVVSRRGETVLDGVEFTVLPGDVVVNRPGGTMHCETTVQPRSAWS